MMLVCSLLFTLCSLLFCLVAAAQPLGRNPMPAYFDSVTTIHPDHALSLSPIRR
ncbi:hypothetical protein BDV12DRAFT_169540 [Aspergillus spectabilis]